MDKWDEFISDPVEEAKEAWFREYMVRLRHKMNQWSLACAEAPPPPTADQKEIDSGCSGYRLEDLSTHDSWRCLTDCQMQKLRDRPWTESLDGHVYACLCPVPHKSCRPAPQAATTDDKMQTRAMRRRHRTLDDTEQKLSAQAQGERRNRAVDKHQRLRVGDEATGVRWSPRLAGLVPEYDLYGNKAEKTNSVVLSAHPLDSVSIPWLLGKKYYPQKMPDALKAV
ncbi:hypothetical protein CDD80_4273 [Ophiocordyceps camponoti-rufipedis]|uniref:Uncharacterized protein n=1 Tax=Ophiocordyceps camponoti-rufipedis TaxID=2004952 RepID=A0A2C5YYD8_9HYPO|nr:hypothetical protein CDD80_4273 [Ophiocordyceps camponoti-rufipedis]